ncbi:MAG: transcriptional regulator of Crp/Fnr family protein [Candidatus Brocadia sinica]|nr:MAG: transcriptional regulator of Crp/Fnr family protein [Candidatus Brocadia sinica]
MNEVKKFDLTTRLKNVPLFSSFSDKQLDMLSKVGIIKSLRKDCTIVYQNGPGDSFYIVLSGRVKVTILNENGKEIVLSILQAGDFFGELSLLDNAPRSASVIAVEDTSLFLLTRNRFCQLITDHTDIVKIILREICIRLRNANGKIESFAFLDVYGRTIRVLQQLAHNQGIKTGNSITILNAPSHQELSSMVGTSRETITRIIKILKKNKTLISYKGRKIVLSGIT